MQKNMSYGHGQERREGGREFQVKGERGGYEDGLEDDDDGEEEEEDQTTSSTQRWLAQSQRSLGEERNCCCHLAKACTYFPPNQDGHAARLLIR